MMYTHPDLCKRVKDQRRQDLMRQAERWRLLRTAQSHRRYRPLRLACRLLYQLGHLLVQLGQRLEAYGAP